MNSQEIETVLEEYGVDASHGPKFSELLENGQESEITKLSVSVAGRIQGKALFRRLTNRSRSDSISSGRDSPSPSSLNYNAAEFAPSSTSAIFTRTHSSTSLSNQATYDDTYNSDYVEEDHDISPTNDIERVVSFLRLDDVQNEAPTNTELETKDVYDSVYYQHSNEDSDEMYNWNEYYYEAEQQPENQLLTPLQEIAAVFGHMPIENINAILELVGYDVELALDALMQPVETVKPKEKKTICRHFLAGGCFRKDCWFSHDLEKTVCKYFIQGRCLKGDECDFSHDMDDFLRASQRALNSSSDSTASPPPGLAQSPITDTQEEFPSLASAASMPQKKHHTSSSRFADIARKGAMAKVESTTPSTKSNNSTNQRNKPTLVSGKVFWVDTGHAVAKAYKMARQEAVDCAIARNKLFQRATEAYKSGDSRSAKAFSLEAHAYNQRMQELHQEAASQLYTSRNSANTNTLDLHGLFPQEAIQILEGKLQQLRRTGGSIFVITGSGHHSRGVAKLAPAVREWLTSNSYSWKEADMGDGYGGCVYIEVG
ncbi:hypothetical protein SmJEL517_g01674 [Synchytrium microbalum]|uniref:Polyadenylate-binding protein-interacting protein 7 n=1 Tax=Synchytrium microbalum TaxID=1806994 RepID=A0A507C4H6_9FUNG|nr:uncharacterized protein SmJEL517_g01674 [Synchytrium microbalum]TPX35877.1 hypothetical protein SmJEL517_g01674 [Synchytrium microbalum]